MIMKRFLTFVFCAAVLFAACQKEPSLVLTGPGSIELSADGGSQTATFTVNRDWTASASDSWVSVSPSSGSASDGPVTVTVRATANTTYEDRSATVTIKAEGLTQSVTVRQAANLGVVVPTKSYQIASDARTIDVEVQANVEYSVSVSDSWIKQTGTKGLTSKTLTFSVEANGTYDARSATITIKPQSGEAQAISVTQAQKDALLVSKATYSMPYGGGEVDVKVESNVEFEVKSGVDWIQYVQTKGLSTSTVVLKVSENGTYKAREGKVTLAQKGGSLTKTVTVKQAGRVAVTGVTLNKSTLSLMINETATLKATVKPDNATDKSVTWSSSNTKVATVDKSGKVTAVAVGTATITAKAGDKSATCTVTVDGSVVKVGKGTHIPPEEGEYELDIQYVSNDFTVVVEKSAQDWLHFYDTKALTSGKLCFYVAENSLPAARSAKVTVKDNKGKASPVTVTLTQDVYETVIKSYDILMEFYNAMGGPNWKKKENWGRKDIELWLWEGVGFNTKQGVTSLKFVSAGLKGEIPKCIGEFAGLEEFWLRNELGVSGKLPSSFGNLTKLEELELSGTSMTSLPDVFSKMTELKYVWIMDNYEMTGPVPESLGASDKLEGLVLWWNAFTGTPPSSWARHYKVMSLVANHFSGSVPAGFLEGSRDVVARKLDSILNQQEGYGFDITGIDIPGYWPDAKIEDLVSGKAFRFADVVAKNKYTVHLVWAPWCPFSKGLMPQVVNFYKKYHKDGLEIISTVMWDQDGTTWKDRDGQIKEIKAKGYGAWYNYYFEPYSDGGQSLLYSATPHAYVYDSEGNTIFSPQQYPDPVQKRFSKAASTELIPFLETLFGPAEEQDDYESTDYSQDGKVLTLQKATKGNGINVVFMGDAYTDRDVNSGLYEDLMKQSMEELFAIEPYKTFRNRFNVYAVKVVSKNGRTGSGYTTALGTEATSISISTGDIDKCFKYALKVPGIKDDKNLLIGVLVNSVSERGICTMIESKQSGVAFYGSSSNVPDAFGNTLRHEVGGHGFAFLDDEYESIRGAASKEHIADRTDKYKKYGWFANVDFTKDPKKVKWSAFLSDSRYKDEVGIYEGALYATGVWRPSANSMMRDNFEYYNAPSRWAIYQRIMKLSGETPSFDAFLKYDAVNRGKKQAAVRPPLRLPEGRVQGEPPVIVP